MSTTPQQAPPSPASITPLHTVALRRRRCKDSLGALARRTETIGHQRRRRIFLDLTTIDLVTIKTPARQPDVLPGRLATSRILTSLADRVDDAPLTDVARLARLANRHLNH